MYNLAVQGIDNFGNLLNNAFDTATVTALGRVLISEWMADSAGLDGLRDPADNLFQDWFEWFNSSSVDVNLSGYYLTDKNGLLTVTWDSLSGQSYRLEYKTDLTAADWDTSIIATNSSSLTTHALPAGAVRSYRVAKVESD